MSDRLVARGDVSVHILKSPEKKGKPVDTETRILSWGESVAVDEVPSYLLEAHEAGRVPLLELVSEEEAGKLLVEAEEAARVDASTFSSVITEEPSPSPIPHDPSAVVDLGDGEVMFVSGDNSGRGLVAGVPSGAAA